MTQNGKDVPIMSAFEDVDLKLIAALWDIRDRKPRDLRPSDRAAIRQSVAAAQSLGDRLIDRIGGAGVMTCRALPWITQVTRIRKAPKRLWLEFSPDDAQGAAALFLEISQNDLVIGLHVPSFASNDDRKDAWNGFRKHKPQIFRSLKRKRSEEDAAGGSEHLWTQSKRRPPVFAIPGDPEHPAGKRSGALTLARSLGSDRLELDDMALHLREAAEIFAPFLDAQDGPTNAALRALHTMEVPQAMRMS